VRPPNYAVRSAVYSLIPFIGKINSILGS